MRLETRSSEDTAVQPQHATSRDGVEHIYVAATTGINGQGTKERAFHLANMPRILTKIVHMLNYAKQSMVNNNEIIMSPRSSRHNVVYFEMRRPLIRGER